MELTVLGTGGPIPTLNRGGTALAIRIDGEPILVDCGPKTVYGLLEAEIDPSKVRNLFFTHHHIDHNASFFHFAISSWTLGRDSLRIYGPDGTETLLEALETIYAEDISYRQELGYPADGITDIEVERVDTDSETRIQTCRVTALPVQHSITTFAYRFDTDDGNTIVFSGDTGRIQEMVSFSKGADILVHDAGIGPVRTDTPTDGLVWTDYTEPMTEDKRAALRRCTATPDSAERSRVRQMSKRLFSRTCSPIETLKLCWTRQPRNSTDRLSSGMMVLPCRFDSVRITRPC